MTDAERSIELEVEVAGTPEEVWRAIATGPGITSWFVPHQIEEREGGRATARFGPGPEMEVPGRVVAWEPPRRAVFDGGPDDGGLAFEWLVEARGESTCIVRLVNTGFGSGEDWDAQYDGMSEGWQMFLANLRLHCAQFAGRTAAVGLSGSVWTCSRQDAWQRLTEVVGLAPNPLAGATFAVTDPDAPMLEGTVVQVAPRWLLLRVDAPAAGTALVAAEGVDGTASVSVWTYLYGSEGAAAVEQDEPRWTAWLEARANSAT